MYYSYVPVYRLIGLQFHLLAHQNRVTIIYAEMSVWDYTEYVTFQVTINALEMPPFDVVMAGLVMESMTIDLAFLNILHSRTASNWTGYMILLLVLRCMRLGNVRVMRWAGQAQVDVLRTLRIDQVQSRQFFIIITVQNLNGPDPGLMGPQ